MIVIAATAPVAPGTTVAAMLGLCPSRHASVWVFGMMQGEQEEKMKRTEKRRMMDEQAKEG